MQNNRVVYFKKRKKKDRILFGGPMLDIVSGQINYCK